MQLLVVNDICGRGDRLEAVLSSPSASGLAAIFVLGNIVAATRQREAHTLQEHHHSLPHDLGAALIREASEDRQTYHMIAEILSGPRIPVFVIPGEQDIALPALQEALLSASGARRLHFVHRRSASLCPGVIVAGFGGCVEPAPWNGLLLQYPEWEARLAFEHLHSSNTLFNLKVQRIFLFATPLRSHRLDVQDGQHAGKAVLNMICRQYQPELICCAGPHEGRGVETVDGMTVVNPGSLAQGAYAVVSIDGDRIKGWLEHLPEPVERHASLEPVA